MQSSAGHNIFLHCTVITETALCTAVKTVQQKHLLMNLWDHRPPPLAAPPPAPPPDWS